MTLYYINLGLDYDEFSSTENDLRYSFQLNTRFICNFFSREIRKIQFKTDGTFNMLSVNLTEVESTLPKIGQPGILKISLPFDRAKYLQIKGTSNFNYYLDLLNKGFRKASEFN